MTARHRAVLPLLVPALLLAGAFLTGCGGAEVDPAHAGSTSVASSSSSAPSSSAASGADESGESAGTRAPAFPANAEPDTAEASADASITVSDVRIGRHDGFDRVVFEVGGTGTPGWDIRYVDQASSQGKGDPVEVAGAAVLQVTLTGAGYPHDTGVEEYSGPDPLSAAGTEVVTEMVFDATFEGTTVAFVGTRARAPFRAYLLEGPTRVVVEVADPA